MTRRYSSATRPKSAGAMGERGHAHGARVWVETGVEVHGGVDPEKAEELRCAKKQGWHDEGWARRQDGL